MNSTKLENRQQNQVGSHADGKTLKCSRSGKKYTRKEHLKTHTVEKPFACPHCSMRFNQSGSLNEHIRTHTGEKPFACTHCSMRFNESGSLNEHIRTHTGEKPFACTHCSMRFNHSGSLKRHLRMHTGEKPFACLHCSMRFNQSGSLNEHIRMHTGEKPFACTHCSMRFSHSGSLKRHLRMHTGEKPFACTHCSMRFIQLASIKSHIARVHSVETDAGSAVLDSNDKNSIQNEKLTELNNGSSPLDCEVNVTLMDDSKEDDSDYKQTFQNDETSPSVHSEQLNEGSILSGESEPTEFSVDSASTIILSKVKEETMNELKSEPECDLIQLIKTEDPEYRDQENESFEDYKYRQLEQYGDWKLMVAPRVELFLLNLPMLSSIHLYV